MSEVNEWSGCYKAGWKGLITDAAFAHPAKFSRALIERIYNHVIKEGWVVAGDRVIDPFGGVALGGFDAMRYGLNWIGCELKEKFVGLGNQNIALWNERFSRMPNWGTAVLLNGDSRELASVIADANCCVSSPPYAGSDTSASHVQGLSRTDPASPNYRPFAVRSIEAGYNEKREYGSTEGQLGAMKAGDHTLAVTSPPYNPPMSQDHNGSRGGQRGTTPSEKGAFVKYGTSEGQLEGMSMEGHDLAVSSPPFPQPYTSGGGINQRGLDRTDGRPNDPIGERTYQSKGGERSEGNLETMEAEGFQAAISSPPYEGIRQDGAGIHKEVADQKGFRPYTDDPLDAWPTQRDQNNLGNQRGEDFWSASRIILEQLYQVIVPGGHAVFVVKSFVRNKQIVDFPGQWAQLCEAVGFKLLHDHHALLTEHYGTQQTMSGEDKELTVARKSFFRRLAESKGSPKIDFENVLCFLRP